MHDPLSVVFETTDEFGENITITYDSNDEIKFK